MDSTAKGIATGGGAVFDALRRWLLAYIRDMACPDEDCRRQFRLKRTHTLRVTGEIATLGRKLLLPPRDRLIAKVIALLHDVGRFEQYKLFRTYNDHASLDHGAQAVRIVKDAGILRDFNRTEEMTIYNAIYFHNKPALPVGLTEENLFFAKLIRDADKLDVYQVVLKRGAYAHHVDGKSARPLVGDVSEPIIAALMQERTVDFADVKNGTDMTLARIGWVFDINFLPALQQVARRQYVDALAATLPAGPKVARVLARVRRYLDRQVPARP